MNRYPVPAAALSVSIFTGSLSIVSSIVNMAMIYISETKLSSVYNRIVFSISFFSTISSAAIVIPITSSTTMNNHVASSLMHGNTSTCAAQGFLVFLGTRSTGFYCCGLSLFYLCSIYIHMGDDEIKKYVEPYIHAISILIPLLLSILFLYWDLFNPVPYASWCSPSATVYPFECSIFDDKHECITKDNNKNPYYIDSMIVICMLIFFSSLLVIVIIWTHVDKPGARSFFLLRRKRLHFAGNKELSHMQKVLTFQASLHIIAFLLPWGLILQQQIYHTIGDRHQSPLNLLLINIFFPLQGFLNSSIYFYQKVHLVRRCDKYINVFDAFWHVLWKPKQIPEFHLAGMELVQRSYSAHSKNEHCSTTTHDEVSNTDAEYYDSKHSTSYDSYSEMLYSSTSTNKDEVCSHQSYEDDR